MREMADETSLLRHRWAFLGTRRLVEEENSRKSHQKSGGTEKYPHLQNFTPRGMKKKKSPINENHTTQKKDNLAIWTEKKMIYTAAD